MSADRREAVSRVPPWRWRSKSLRLRPKPSLCGAAARHGTTFPPGSRWFLPNLIV